MNYQKIYDSLIAKRQQNPAIKTGPYTVVEHYIFPKSMGGSNNKSNLVVLTNKEHFVAHHLLWKIYQNAEMTHAFMLMSTTMGYKISAKIYAILVEQHGEYLSEQMKGNTIWVGRKHSQQTKEKMSKNNWMKTDDGKKWFSENNPSKNESTRQKISNALKGKSSWTKGLSTKTDERIKALGQKISQTLKGHNVSDETRKKISDKHKGQKLDREKHKNFIFNAKGKYWWTNGTQQILAKECPGDDWHRGRIHKKLNLSDEERKRRSERQKLRMKNRKVNHLTGRKNYTNGIINIKIDVTKEKIPDGFYPGMVYHNKK